MASRKNANPNDPKRNGGKKSDPPLPTGWVSLQTALTQGVPDSARKQLSPPPQGLPPAPQGWVPLRSSLIDGVKSPKTPPVDERLNLPQAPPQEPPPPPPPETFLTIYEAMAELYSVVIPEAGVLADLETLREENRQGHIENRIPEAEFRRYDAAMEEIRQTYLQEADDATSWWMDNYFRLFDSPERNPEVPASVP